MFKDKVLLITGGTGSFGNTVLKRFVDTDIYAYHLVSFHHVKRFESLLYLYLRISSLQRYQKNLYRLLLIKFY